MNMIIVYGVGACMSLFLQPNLCDKEPWRFTEFYAIACHAHNDSSGSWAGSGGELTQTIMKRVADGAAEYQDYLERRRELCGKKEK